MTSHTVEQILRSAAWTSPGLANLHLPATPQYVCDPAPRKQDFQLVKGPRNSIRRYHVRCWAYGNDALGSAHEEIVSLFVQHVVTSFEGGEQCLADDVDAAGRTVNRSAVFMERRRNSPLDDGRATEVT